MNDKIMGSAYIIIALLIVVVKFAVPQFFDYLIGAIAVILLVLGIYILFFKK